MKLLSTTTVSILALTAAASAADPGAQPPDVYDWSGFYIGGHAGIASNDTAFTDRNYEWYGKTFHLPGDGAAFGVQGGYNWQHGAAVLGIEGDFSGFANRRKATYFYYSAIENRLNWMATLRGRAGIGLDRTLVYFTGGLAVADFTRSWNENGDPEDSWPDLGGTKAGVIGGFGVEHAFSGRWSARFEGLFASFASNSATNEDGREMATSDGVAIARLGLNYRFDNPASANQAAFSYGTPTDFSGFYAGGNLGGALGKMSQTDIDGYDFRATYDHRNTGITGGGQLGYNWQNGAMLFGVVGDMNFYSNDSNRGLYDREDPYYRAHTGIDWMASLRARTGIVAGNSLMYLTGGIAVARLNNDMDGTPSDNPVWDMGGTKGGLIVGGGFEQAFTDKLNGFVEATYAAFPGSTVYGTSYGSDYRFRGDGGILSVRTGVNYRFGGSRDMSGGVEMALVDWSGAYAGVDVTADRHSSAIWDKDYYTHGGGYALPSLGAGFGGHVGYNWQDGNFVYGALADIGVYTNEMHETVGDYRTITSDLSWMATLRGRAGLATGSSYMYATGGLAIADIDLSHTYQDDPDSSFDVSGTRIGWVAGMGVEHALTDKVSLKLEGLYSKFGQRTGRNNTNCNGTGLPCEMEGLDNNVAVKLGVSYRFGSPS